MSNPSNNLRETTAALELVIDSLVDSQAGFQKLGDHLHSEPLKTFFLEESLMRASFRGDLETVLHQEGVHDIKESGSITETLRRTWGELKAKLGGSDQSLLETAHAAEDETRKVYADALDRELPFPIRQILVSQAAHVQLSHEFIQSALHAATV
jgi:uncharacterized protein (TIGR02284 family)